MRQPVENAEIMAGGPLRNTEAEPSGVRLMAFLAAHRTEVLAREQNNERFIHLYGTGGYWAAFERSAYQLCRLFPRNETAVFHFAAYPFPVVMASIADGELRAYSRRHILRTVNEILCSFHKRHCSSMRYCGEPVVRRANDLYNMETIIDRPVSEVRRKPVGHSNRFYLIIL